MAKALLASIECFYTQNSIQQVSLSLQKGMSYGSQEAKRISILGAKGSLSPFYW